MISSFKTFFVENSKLVLQIGAHVLLAAIVWTCCYFIAKMVRRAINKAAYSYKKLDSTLVPVLCTSSTYLIYIVGIVVILDIFGVNTSSLIALLGAAGLAIGFALKDTLSNIAAGIMLLFLRPFRTGDFIEYGPFSGKVCEINLFNTVLETLDGLYIFSPNSVLWHNSIKNFTRNGKRRIDLVVGISYDDSIEAGLKVLQNVALSESRFLKGYPTQVMVSSMGDSAVNLQLRGWVKNEDYWPTYWDLNRQVKEAIASAGLTIPFPQHDLHIISNVSQTK